MAVGELHAEEQKMTRTEVSLFTWLHNHVLHVEDQVRASDTKPTMSLLPAGVQPRLIQGIRRRDGVGEGQETTA